MRRRTWGGLALALVAGGGGAGALALVAGCGGAARGRPLASGERAAGPAVGLGAREVLAAGVLGYAVGFAGDGDHVASVELALGFSLVDRELAGVRARERRRIALGEATWDVVDLDVAGGRAWVASADGLVRGYELASTAQVARWPLGDGATAVAVARGGDWVATGSAGGVVCLRRAGDGALLQCVAAHDAPVSALGFSADGALLASASWDGRAVVWEVPSLKVRWTSPARGSANDVAFAPDGSRLAIARSGAPPRRTPQVAAREAARASAGGPDDVVEVWAADHAGAAPLATLRGHDGPVVAVAWTADGAQVVSGSWDRSVRLWDAASGREVARADGLPGIVRDVAVSPDGRRVACAAWAPPGEAPGIAAYDLLYEP